MRISDWSSDVCSSDLHHHEEPREDSIANVGQRALGLLIGGGDLAHGIGGCKAGASQLVVKAAETANVRAAQRGRELAGEATQRKHANLGDRKSVVAGKERSVRVNLGGRRIHKKKKKNIK